jgi:hypothetical protein
MRDISGKTKEDDWQSLMGEIQEAKGKKKKRKS